MGLLALSPEGREQAGDKEAEQVLLRLENGTEGVRRAVAEHFSFVCLLCRRTREGAWASTSCCCYSSKERGISHFLTLQKSDLFLISLSSSTLCMLIAAYPEVQKSCSPSICPEWSCSQRVGMDSRDQGNNVTNKLKFSILYETTRINVLLKCQDLKLRF